MSFYRDTIRVARKEHKCDICKGVIKKGEKYHEKAGLNYEGEFFHCKECESCQPVIAEFCQSDYADDGYCGEWIQEWWRDVKCYNCQHRFPPCDPDEQCKKTIRRAGAYLSKPYKVRHLQVRGRMRQHDALLQV